MKMFNNLYINNKLFSDKYYVTESILDRVRGLMFNSKKILLFKVNDFLSIHTFFCFFPITLVYLKNHKVVEVKCLNPFQIYKNSKKADLLVEIPGCVDVKEGDVFEFGLEDK